MPIANLKPNERYAMIGKTRSGKTRLAIVIAATIGATMSEAAVVATTPPVPTPQRRLTGEIDPNERLVD